MAGMAQFPPPRRAYKTWPDVDAETVPEVYRRAWALREDLVKTVEYYVKKGWGKEQVGLRPQVRAAHLGTLALGHRRRVAVCRHRCCGRGRGPRANVAVPEGSVEARTALEGRVRLPVGVVGVCWKEFRCFAWVKCSHLAKIHPLAGASRPDSMCRLGRGESRQRER